MSKEFINGNGKRKLLEWFRFLVRKKGVALALPDDPALLDNDQFARQLRRDRARSDRTDTSFLLMTFEIAGQSGPQNDYRELHMALAHTIYRRVRKSDVVGEFENKIGLILHETHLGIASQFTEEIESLFHQRVLSGTHYNNPLPEIVCRACTYPNDVQAMEEQTFEEHVR